MATIFQKVIKEKVDFTYSAVTTDAFLGEEHQLIIADVGSKNGRKGDVGSNIVGTVSIRENTEGDRVVVGSTVRCNVVSSVGGLSTLQVILEVDAGCCIRIAVEISTVGEVVSADVIVTNVFITLHELLETCIIVSLILVFIKLTVGSPVTSLVFNIDFNPLSILVVVSVDVVFLVFVITVVVIAVVVVSLSSVVTSIVLLVVAIGSSTAVVVAQLPVVTIVVATVAAVLSLVVLAIALLAVLALLLVPVIVVAVSSLLSPVSSVLSPAVSLHVVGVVAHVTAVSLVVLLPCLGLLVLVLLGIALLEPLSGLLLHIRVA